MNQHYEHVNLSESDLETIEALDAWGFYAPLFPKGRPVNYAVPWDRTHGYRVANSVPEDAANSQKTNLSLKDQLSKGLLASMSGNYDFQCFPVPGAYVPAAGITFVVTHPSHRRKGLLRRMIADNFNQAREEGKSLAVLTASEAEIYGRFGFGIAGYYYSGSISRGAELHPVPGSEELSVQHLMYDFQLQHELIAKVHAAATEVQVGNERIIRPGWVTFEYKELQQLEMDSPQHPDKEPKWLIVVHEKGEAVGYAKIRREMKWLDTGADGKVSVLDYGYSSTAAAHRLWQALLDIDLSNKVELGLTPPDDAIFKLVKNERTVGAQRSDALWARILDVPQALAARRYQAAGSFVLAVADADYPENSANWLLEIDDDGIATVTRSEQEADIELAIPELSSLYMAATSLAQLAAGGRVKVNNQQAMLVANIAFGWPVAPGINWIF